MQNQGVFATGLKMLPSRVHRHPKFIRLEEKQHEHIWMPSGVDVDELETEGRQGILSTPATRPTGDARRAPLKTEVHERLDDMQL